MVTITLRRKTNEVDAPGPWAVAAIATDNRGRRVVERRWTAEIRAVTLFVAFSAIYLCTRTANYSIDAVRIADDILQSQSARTTYALIHPGYLLFGPIASALWRLARSFGYVGGPLPVMAGLNCICGGIGIGIMSLLLRAVLTRSRALTVLVPIALGFSFGYWMSATDARAEMPATAAAILAMYLLVQTMLLPTPSRAIAAGLAVSLGILLHIFVAPMLIVGVIAVALAEYTQGTTQEENRARSTNILAFLAAGIIPAVLVYAIVGLACLHLESFGRWQAWFEAGASRDWWWSPHPLENLRLDAYGFRRALFVEPGEKSGTFHLSGVGGALHAGLFWTTLLLWFAAVYAIASTTAFLIRTHYGSFLTISLATVGIYAAVFTVVSPGFFVYWVPATISCSIIMAICCSYFRGRRRGSLWLVGIGCWTAIFAASNYVQFVGPHLDRDTNPNMVQAKDFEDRTLPGDIIVVSGFGDDTSLEEYVPYFAHREVFSLRASLEEHDGNSALAARDLQTLVDRALGSGHKAYASGELWENDDIRDRLRDEYGIHSTQQLFGSLQRAPAWRDPQNPDLIVWKLLASPAGAPTVSDFDAQ